MIKLGPKHIIPSAIVTPEPDPVEDTDDASTKSIQDEPPARPEESTP